MTDLRKAAEAVLEAWDWDWSEPRNEALRERMEALRQALAQPEEKMRIEGSGKLTTKPYPDGYESERDFRKALAQPEQEPVGYVTIENISSWAQVPSIKWFKKPTEGPLYTAPVDAVNMTQECVDETAKGEHKPYGYVWTSLRDGMEVRFSRMPPNKFYNPQDIKPVYTAPPKREWVGLMDEEVDECYYWKDRLWTTDELVRHVEAKLKEKNT